MEDSFREAFPYTRLPRDGSLRVLVLHPGGFDEPISASLRVVPPNYHTFDALSYVWNDAYSNARLSASEALVHIQTPDGKEARTLAISANLFLALRRLRLNDESRILWIDALCINQEDVVEKNQQVPKMGAIYGGAQKVIVWLGEDDRWTREAMRTFRRWADTFRLDPSQPQFNLLRQLVASGSLITSQQHFEAITRRAWFSRAWTFQEACLSRRTEIICGSSSCDWATFHDACSAVVHAGLDHLIFEENTNIKTLLDYSAGAEQASPHDGSHRSLSNLVHRTRLFECSDPRDKIYSLLSVAKQSEEQESKILPDYSSPVAQVYQDFTRSRILADQDLRILSLVKQANEDSPLAVHGTHRTRGVVKTGGLPSWCPDLQDHDCVDYVVEDDNIRGAPKHPAATRFPQPFVQQYSEVPPTYRVNLSQSHSVKGSIMFSAGDSSRLGVWGARISTVKHVVSISAMTEDPYIRQIDGSESAHAAASNLHQSESSLSTDFNMFEHFFHVLTPIRTRLRALRIRLLDNYAHRNESVIMAVLRTCTADLLPASRRLPLLYKKVYFPRHFDWHFWSTRTSVRALVFGTMTARLMGSGRRITVQGADKSWSALNSTALRRPAYVHDMYEDLLGISDERRRLKPDSVKTTLPVAFLSTSVVSIVLCVTPIFRAAAEYLASSDIQMLLYTPFVLLYIALRWTTSLLTGSLKPLASDPAPPSSFKQYGANMEHKAEREIAAEIQNAINRASWNRVFFITHDGRFGLGPIGTREGDEIYTLLGAHVPFVLRRIEPCNNASTEHEEFRLLGESYVHGVMDGEFWVWGKNQHGNEVSLDQLKTLSSKIVLV